MFKKVKKTTGEFGIVVTTTGYNFSPVWFDEGFGIKNFAFHKKIQRLLGTELILEVNIITSLDKNEEFFDISPKITVIGEDTIKKWGIIIFFNNTSDINYYEFRGAIGALYGSSNCVINADTHDRAKVIVDDMCNPNKEFKMDALVNLMYNSGNPETVKFSEDWEIFFEFKDGKYIERSDWRDYFGDYEELENGEHVYIEPKKKLIKENNK